MQSEAQVSSLCLQVLHLDVSSRALLVRYLDLLTFADILHSIKSMAFFYLYNYSISLILDNFASVDSRQFFYSFAAGYSITFNYIYSQMSTFLLVICLRCHVLSYDVNFMKFPWKFNFYLLIELAVPHSELLHLKAASASLI